MKTMASVSITSLALTLLFLHSVLSQGVMQLFCSKSPVEISLDDSYYELRTTTTLIDSPECAFSLKTKPGFIMEILTPIVAIREVWRMQKDIFGCHPGSFIIEPFIIGDVDNVLDNCPSIDLARCRADGCPEKCPLARIGAFGGFLSMAPIDDYQSTEPPMLISNSNQVFLRFCQGWNTGMNTGSISIKIRIVPQNGEEVKASFMKQTFSAPMFPTGYIQSGQIYRYSLSKFDEKGDSFTHVLITFDDLDLDQGELIEVGSQDILQLRERKTVYFEFDDVTNEIDVIVRTANKRGQWSSKLGWRFTVNFINETVSYDYYGYENDDKLDKIETVTRFYDLKQDLKSHRISIKVDRLLDHLLIFGNLPHQLSLSVHVPVFTQNKENRLLMQIVNGEHSASSMVANFTSSEELENSQPRNGYVMSSGAYIRVVAHVEQFSLLTVVVTPFLVHEPVVGVPDQCCNFPTVESERGGFLCTHVMRCIPAESACDTVNNCGESSVSEDEQDAACRGARLETYGMTARNMCRTDARTVLCPWGTWVRHQEDCYPQKDSNQSPSITLILGALIGVFAAVLSVASIFYRTRLVRQRQATERQRRAQRRGLDHRDSRFMESGVMPRSLAGSIENLDGNRSDLRLQMGALPPSYDDIRQVGKPPPMYRENALFPYYVRDGDEVSVSSRDHPPSYNIAMTHPKADDLPSFRPRLNAQDSVTPEGDVSPTTESDVVTPSDDVTSNQTDDVSTPSGDVTSNQTDDVTMPAEDDVTTQDVEQPDSLGIPNGINDNINDEVSCPESNSTRPSEDDTSVESTHL